MSGVPPSESPTRMELAPSRSGAALASVRDPTSAPPQALPLRWRSSPVDDLCDEFESLWRAGGQPRIEDYLPRASPEVQGELLSQLVGVEVHWRQQRNERPLPEDYVRRFPLCAAVVERRFAGQEAPPASLVRRTGNSRCETCGAQHATTLGCLGQYQLLAELGRGGMGVVYKARQCSADRLVALKVIRSDCFQSLDPAGQAEILERFQHEARAAARLQHENIVTIYEVGEVDGRPFFSMQYVAGGSLADALREGPLDARRAARYLEAVARGIHEAHQHGILHRDLKPQNVVVEQATDVPRVMDFGLAKLRGGDEQLTQAGQVIGTPAYMAPEQAANAADVGPEADVYALGATLYALLTGRPPFQAATPWETLRQVISSEPVSPARLNHAIDRDLETICLKCLHKEPARRYDSAAAMADDLARFLRGEPISARPVGRVEHTVRWCRRNPVMAGLMLLAATGFAVALAASTLGYVHTAAALQKSRASVRQLREAVDELFTDVSENTLLNEPGMQPLRKQLLDKALAYYQRFLTDHAADPTVQDELGLAYFRVAMITQTLDAPEKAIPVFRDAEQLQGRLVAEKASAERLRALSNTLTSLGRALQLTRRLDEAATAFTNASHVRQQLVQRDEANGEFQRLWANSVMNLGLLQGERGNAEQAQADYQAAQQIRESHLRRHPEDRKMQLDLAKGHFNIAALLRVDRDTVDAAQTHLVAATEIFQQLVEEEPEQQELQKSLALCWRVRGDLATAPAARRDLYRRAHEVLEKLVDENPNVLDFQLERAAVSINLGDVLVQHGDRTGALARFDAARQILERLVVKAPQNPRYSRDLGVALRLLGEQQQAAGDSELAQRYLRQAVLLFDVLLSNHPGHEEFQRLRTLAAEMLQETAEKPQHEN